MRLQIGFEQQYPGQSRPERKCARSSISWSLNVLDTLLIVLPGIVTDAVFSAVVIMVMVRTILTPPLLKTALA